MGGRLDECPFFCGGVRLTRQHAAVRDRVQQESISPSHSEAK
jgi:hypothetical protein